VTVAAPQLTEIDVQAFTNQLGQLLFGYLGMSASDLFYAESTRYDTDTHPELAPYTDLQVQLVAQGQAVFAPPDSSQVHPLPSLFYSECFNNGSTVDQSNTFTRTESTTRSFTWSLTETLSVGWKSSTKVAVPDVAQEQTEWSVNFSFGATQSQTKSETQTWAIEQPVVIPPESSINVKATIFQASYDVPFTIPVNMTGCLAAMSKQSVPPTDNLQGFFDLAGAWSIPIGGSEVDLVAFVPMGSLASKLLPGNPPLPLAYDDQDTAAYNLPGVFTGSQGIEYTVDVMQYPLHGCPQGVPVVEVG
jgi:hypothetical protein